MKIYATADLHGSQFRLNIVLKNIKKYSPDLVIICGDITQFGPGDVAENFLNQIKVETLAVTGNIDSSDVAKAIDKSNATNIELERIVKKGIPFIGISGINNEEFKFLEKKKILDKKSVLVTHIPPYGSKDKVFLGMHGGSKELRKIVDKYNPRLVLCGHIHEDPGFMKLRVSNIINCSLGKRGEGAIIDINDDISINMI
jgi:Icc-related predicted phosphoesterase